MPTKKSKRTWRPREETLQTAEFKKAHAEALAKRKKKRCAHGHDLKDPQNVHAGTLLRTGKIMCNACWQGYAEKSRAKKAKPKATRKPKHPKAPKPKTAPVATTPEAKQ
jgi:hypothetical protein